MPPDDQSPGPAADAPASAAAATSPQPASAPVNPHELFRFSDAIADSGLPVGPDDADVSNEGERQEAAPAVAAAQDDKPAPGDEPPASVKASDAPEPGPETDPSKTPSRREAERLAHEQEIARLQAQLAERDPATLRENLRQEILAEQARAAAETIDEDFLGNQDQFDALNNRPTNSLSADEYNWLEERKERREKYSPIEKHFRAIYDRRLAEINAQAETRAEQRVNAGWETIRADQGKQIEASSKLPGVDPAKFREEGANWQTMAEQIHAAGAAWKEAEVADRLTKAEAEVARLQQQIKDRDSEGLANRRAPAVVGRSAGATPTPGGDFDPTLGWRGNLAGAFATNGTG